MDLKPIITADDHRAALAEIERLWGAVPDSADDHRLDALVALVAAYEDRMFPLAPQGDPVAVIVAHMDMAGHGRADLAAVLGSASRASEILNRRRALTLPMIRRLSEAWGLPPALLIPAYDLVAA